MTPKIIPVIHYADDDQAQRNAKRAFDAGCDGVLLIQMDGNNTPLFAISRDIKARWPDHLVGINFLGVDPESALDWNIEGGLDMTWTDEQLTHSSQRQANESVRLNRRLSQAKGHLFFSGVAFKHQRPEPRPVDAARRALDLGFIPTTSGPATGVAAETDAIAGLRAGIGSNVPLAIASGITPDNVAEFAPYLSHILVATGVSSSFHEFDPVLLEQLVTATRAAT